MKKKKKIWPIILIIALVIIFVIIKIVGSMNEGKEVALVTTAKVERGDLQDFVNVSGTVESREKAAVFSAVTGKVSEVNVSVGDAVKKSDMLVSFDMEYMDKQLRQATLQYDKNMAMYQSAMTGNDTAKQKYDEAITNLAVLEQQIKDYTALLEKLQNQQAEGQRYAAESFSKQAMNLNAQLKALQTELAGMAAAGGEGTPEYISKAEEAEQIQANLLQLEYSQQSIGSSQQERDLQKQITETQKQLAEFEAYKAKMESQKATGEATVMDSYDKVQYTADKELFVMSYEEVKAQHQKAENGIVADFDGVVTACSVLPGGMVSDGMQVMTVESTEKVKMVFHVSMKMLEKLEIGQKADVNILDNVYEGRVSKIDRMAQDMSITGTKAPMVKVEMEILNPDDKIILGINAKADIYTGKAENAMLIPVEAINVDKNSDFVYVVEDGIVVRKDIVCGVASSEMTEVVSGLTESDVLVRSALTPVEEGMAVTVMPEGIDMSVLGDMQVE